MSEKATLLISTAATTTLFCVTAALLFNIYTKTNELAARSAQKKVVEHQFKEVSKNTVFGFRQFCEPAINILGLQKNVCYMPFRSRIYADINSPEDKFFIVDMENSTTSAKPDPVRATCKINKDKLENCSFGKLDI